MSIPAPSLRSRPVTGSAGRGNVARQNKATAAHQVDHAARLVALASRNATVAEALLDSFDAMTPQQWARESVYARGVVLGIVQDKARDLAPADTGTDDAKSMLGALAEGLGVAYRQIKAAETADDRA